MTNDDRMTLLARVGFSARGLVYVLIGWFALDVAVNGGQPVDNQGALSALAQAPLGHALLGVCAAGFAGYAIWRLAEAAAAPAIGRSAMKARFERLAHALSGLAHVTLAFFAARLALRQASAQAGSPGDSSARSWSAWLLDQPGGVPLLTLAGVAIVVVAVAQALKAYKGRFDELGGDTPAPRFVRRIGQAGYAARALIFALIGWFVISAALDHNATRAGGLGEALKHLRSQDSGVAMLSVVAAGLTLFGVFSLIEARYRRIRVKRPDFLR